VNAATYPLEGGCDCRAVRYRMETAPLVVHCCHCRWCQRESGAAFALNAMIESDRVTHLGLEPEIVHTPSDSGAGQKIARCPRCRVAVWSHYSGSGRLTTFVRVGTLDEPDALPPDVHIFTASKQPWVVLPPDAKAFTEYYERERVWSAEALTRRQALLQRIEAHQAALPGSWRAIDTAPITDTDPTVEAMQRRVARFAALVPTDDYIDAAIPGCERTTWRVIGEPGAAPIEAQHFHMNLVRCEPGKCAPLHNHLTQEVFVALTGRWEVFWGPHGARSLVLEPWDTIDIPPGVSRGFRNVGEAPAMLLGIAGGRQPGLINWPDAVRDAARKAGVELP
jgi:mannose-6-phosphate isomerase-like protein (cupin superfamily)